MKKIDIYPNNEVIYALPPEAIDENEPICLVDYLLPQSKDSIFDYGKVRRFGKDKFTMKIGGTTYEVSTHLNIHVKESVLQQFKDLLEDTRTA